MNTYGQIYKITNDVNGKFYIGQTINGLQNRMHRHIVDAIGERHLNTHFARVIRKYGHAHFHIEEIDSAKSAEELTRKEYEWIRKTDAIHIGYNETSAEFKCGGNTYRSKTKNELDTIKNKISDSNKRGQNGNARPIKMINSKNGIELHFDSVKSAQLYFNEPHHTTFTRRCKHIINTKYRNEWNVSYEEHDYDDINVIVKKHKVHVGCRKISVYDKQTSKTTVYSSYRDFERKTI